MMKLKSSVQNYLNDLIKNSYKKDQLQLDDICEKLGIECFEAEFDNSKVSGMLIKDKENNKFTIYVNSKHSTTRQRFTIAHEIGHYISYKHQSHSYAQLNTKNEIEDYAVSFRKESVQSAAETEANLIAAEMLMPEKRIKAMIKEGLTIEEIAEAFYVSEAAVTIRLKSLYPGLMVV